MSRAHRRSGVLPDPLLALRNRQSTCAVDLRVLRRIALQVLRDHFQLQNYELCLHLVAASEMARLNHQFHHQHGSTDVLTFDLSPNPFPNPNLNRNRNSALSASPQTVGRGVPSAPHATKGEIFISIDDAIANARQFRTTWQSELVRYLIHGLLHLHGFDDQRPADRRRMKREENRLLREVSRQLPLRRLARSSPACQRGLRRSLSLRERGRVRGKESSDGQ